MDYLKFIVSNQEEDSISIERAKMSHLQLISHLILNIIQLRTAFLAICRLCLIQKYENAYCCGSFAFLYNCVVKRSKHFTNAFKNENTIST